MDLSADLQDQNPGDYDHDYDTVWDIEKGG